MSHRQRRRPPRKQSIARPDRGSYDRSHGEEDSDHRSGRVRLRPITQETTMPSVSERPEAPTAIQTHLAASFVSLELSRSIWLITSLSPGSGEKMSKHSVRAGDVAALLARFPELKRKATERTGKSFPIVVIQEPGLDGSWFHRVCKAKASKAMSSIRRRSRRRADGGAPRQTGSTARPCFARFWRISVATLGCARW